MYPQTSTSRIIQKQNAIKGKKRTRKALDTHHCTCIAISLALGRKEIGMGVRRGHGGRRKITMGRMNLRDLRVIIQLSIPLFNSLIDRPENIPLSKTLRWRRRTQSLLANSTARVTFSLFFQVGNPFLDSLWS